MFFARRPERRHRVRLAHSTEIEQMENFVGGPVSIPPGYRIFLAIRNVAPGYRMKICGFCPEGSDMDLSEEVCASIYEGLEDVLQPRYRGEAALAAGGAQCTEKLNRPCRAIRRRPS